MIINHNISALNTYRQLSSNNVLQNKSLEKLSSGYRINRAGDDAAGLAISEKMRGQIRGLNQASRNAQDGISLIQTAEGALNETHAILQRMRELAVQASTDTNTNEDRLEIQKEINELTTEITRISTDTQFNNMNLLDGTFTDKVFHIGANAGQAASIEIGDMQATALGFTVDIAEGASVSAEKATIGDLQGVSFTVQVDGAAGNGIEIEFVDPGANDQTIDVDVTGNKITVSLATDGSGNITSTATAIASAINGNTDAAALVAASGTGTDAVSADTTGPSSGGVDAVAASEVAIKGLNVTTQGEADGAISIVDAALSTVSSERSKLGAMQNRLEHTIANLDTSAENLQASESRIRDVDMAKEMMEFTKMNILSQAATAMLAQANQQPQMVLQLLR